MVGQLRTLAARLRRARSGGGIEDVRRAFAGYKKVLDDNNSALEVISDMGEKMGGGFLFDVTYVQRAYGDLGRAMGASLHDFDALTAGRYPALPQVFERIDATVRSVIAGAPPAGPLLVPLDEISWDKARAVGAKNFHLSELAANAGASVPAGFAISTVAFDEVLRENGLEEMAAQLTTEQGSGKAFAALHERLLGARLPESVQAAIGEGLERLRAACGAGDRAGSTDTGRGSGSGKGLRLAVRSSGEEEDGTFSFAGQFETVLGVPATREAAEQAYREVIASLYSVESLAYCRLLGLSPAQLRMAVGFMAMVDAVCAGVAYTADPLSGDSGRLLVSANWGLGQTVVAGKAQSDFFTLSKHQPFDILSSSLGAKEQMSVAGPGGVWDVPVPSDLRRQFSVEPHQLAELARQAVAIEEYYRQPQDIEWAIDREGRLFILQSRPLRVAGKEEGKGHAGRSARAAREYDAPGAIGDVHPVLLTKGIVVQGGVVSGRVFVARSAADLEGFPRGAVLVAPQDSPQLVRVAPLAAAIITDSGTPTSHMSSISREFRIPTVINTTDATRVLRPGAEITLVAGEDGFSIRAGRVPGLLEEGRDSYMKLEELYEFRRRKFIMRYIAPLSLTDPLGHDFQAANCRTMHDILRFIHEKSVRELTRAASGMQGGRGIRRLELPVHEAIELIDLGNGLEPGAGNRGIGSPPGSESTAGAPEGTCGIEDIRCLPLRALLETMCDPAGWSTEAVPLNLSDLFMGMVRASDPAVPSAVSTGNTAVISRQYMNLSLRFGYHFNVIDSYCSPRPADNYIYFRFMGGAADATKRQRRVHLIESILTHYGFACSAKGDLIEARISHIESVRVLALLGHIGRLVAFTRQLDAMLTRDSLVEELAGRFLAGGAA